MNGSKDGRRRRRSRPHSSTETPPPPPPPPDSLVSLLQSDKKVLEYFQALQANLDADVQRWKTRAKEYKGRYEDLQAQLSKEGSNRKKPARKKAKLTKARKSTNKSDGSTTIVEAETAAPEANSPKELETEGEIVPIDDSIFDISDEDSVQDIPPVTENNGTTKTRRPEIDIGETYCRLCEAYRCLEQLGVSVTSKEAKSQESATKNDLNGMEKVDTIDLETTDGDATFLDAAEADAEHVEAAAPLLVRRSDNDVLSDLMHALRTLSHIHLLAKEAKQYEPFSSRTLVPRYCEDEALNPIHPASKGLAFAFRALWIMHAHSASYNDDTWDSIFVDRDDNNGDAIRIGMHNRRAMVELVVASIQGEIASTWSDTDRSSRLITTALHHNDVEGKEAVVEDDSPLVTVTPSIGSKSQSRLASLLERCMLARLVHDLNLHWGQPQETGQLVLDYIMSTAPSLGVEEYPKLPPVLSFCVLESLICRDVQLEFGEGKDELTHLSKAGPWFSEFLRRISYSEERKPIATRSIVLAMNTAACVWEERLQSNDDRISDISRVEVACLNRLLKSEKSWLYRMDDAKTLDGCRKIAMEIVNESLAGLLKIDKDLDKALTDENNEHLGIQLALPLALTMSGDEEAMEMVLLRSYDVLREAASASSPAVQSRITSSVRTAMLSCCVAYRQVNVRQLDSFRQSHGAPYSETPTFLPFAKSEEMVKILIETHQPDARLDWDFASGLAQCVVQLACGEALFRLVYSLVNAAAETSRISGNINQNIMVKAISTMLAAGETPTVRVINLRRRRDRFASFLAQAQRDQLLVVRAVARLDTATKESESYLSSEGKADYGFWGEYAFDGRGRAAEVDTSLSNFIETGKKLCDYVETHWRPNDLKAFDRDAREDDASVMMSGSERACALSHIASWKGVARSLSTSAFQAMDSELFPHSANTLRLFRISGFARGPPLLHENNSMPPSPVCVVLEDDAILVDRFVERLAALLEELPRDFHFCSLGYSRPRTAPIVKFSSQLGIPSCIWYLTGYVLSLEGASTLLDSLPVVGPVDSWIGLKMCSNWDNVFGHHVGVGIHSRPLAEAPPRKDLVRILKFRAFCALTPLCSQKFGTNSMQGTSGRTWRQRDTDITYSGNL